MEILFVELMFLISASPELTKLKMTISPTQFENTIFYWDIAKKIFSAKSYLNLITKDFSKLGQIVLNYKIQKMLYQAISDISAPKCLAFCFFL